MSASSFENLENQVIDECESTNDLAKKLGDEGAPHGTWVSARRQTQGRGRQGRVWQVIEGNLFLSVIVRVQDGYPITWIPLKAAVAVTKALEKISPGYPLKIKWPNDLVVREGSRLEKAGGILCEGVGNRGGAFVVVGIGLNCTHAPEVDQPTRSLGVDVGQIRPLVIEALLSEIDLPIDEIGYLSRSVFTVGENLEWVDLRSSTATVENGKFIGVGKLGELLVDCAGHVRGLYSEEVKIKSALQAGV